MSEPKLYVKRPLPVTAQQWFVGVEHPRVKKDAFIAVTEDGFVRDQKPGTEPYYLETLENQRLYLTEGCYIVGPGAGGEYWPVDEKIFEATYKEQAFA